MLYLWLKWLHILSSTILFGTGIGTASNMLMAHRTRDDHEADEFFLNMGIPVTLRFSNCNGYICSLFNQIKTID